MDHFAAWLLLPLLMVVVSAGCGLLVRRAIGESGLDELMIPLGFCLAILIVGFPYALGLDSTFALALLLIATVAGFALPQDRLAVWPGRIPAIGTVGAYTLFIAPVAFSGTLAFAGYLILGDTSVHLAMIDYIADHGHRLVDLPPSSYAQVPQSLLNVGYPLGLHDLLATLHAAVPVDVAWLYQPFIATTIAFAVIPAARLLRTAGIEPRLAAVGAVLAVGSYLPLAYAMQGGLKEMAMILFVLLAGVIAVDVAAELRQPRAALAFALVTAAGFAVFSTGALPWFGVIALFILIGAAIRGRAHVLRLLKTGAIAIAAFIVLSLPALIASFSFYAQGSRLLTSSTGVDLGNLLGPLKFWQVFGIWNVSDFRIAPANPWVDGALIGAMIVVAGFGVAAVARHRYEGIFNVAAASLIVWITLPAGPYIEAKLLAILAPMMILLAIVGVHAIYRSGRRPEAIVLAVVLAAALLVSDSYIYRGVYLSPDRHHELQQIGNRFAGKGPATYLEFDEYGKHFLRKMQINSAFEAYTPQPAEPLDPKAPVYGHTLDLDQLKIGFVTDQPLLVQRRSPVASRPPTPFKRVFSGDYFDVWRRQDQPKVLAHLPLGDGDNPVGAASCERLEKFVAGATAGGRKSNAKLVAARRPAVTVLPVTEMQIPADWLVDPNAGVVGPNGSGLATGKVQLPQAGRYRVWMSGTFGRGVDVQLNGESVGKVADAQNSGGMALAGSVELPAGENAVDLMRGGNSLAPENGRGASLGKLYFEPIIASSLQFMPLTRWRALCDEKLDWVEIVTVAESTGKR